MKVKTCKYESLQEGLDNIKRDLIDKDRPGNDSLHKAIHENRKVINDIHKRVVALAKEMKSRSSAK